MVLATRNESGVQVLSAGVRKTIQSIKEIVGNHSDAEIYVALKETNMDPNETAQKLLNQDPFHEVKRKRDRKKENSAHKGFVAVEPRKSTEPRNNTEPQRIPLQTKQNTHFGHNARRGGFNRNVASDEGASQKFRVVRDNRVNQNAGADSKSVQSSTSNNERSVKRNMSGTSGHEKPPGGQYSSQTLNVPADSRPERAKDSAPGGLDKNELVSEKSIPVPIAASRVQPKTTDPIPQSTNSSNSSVVGVYSSASDPVHVPSLHSRPAANVGAIRREVGVVGPRRQSSENSAKSSQTVPFPNFQSSREINSRESIRQISVSKGEQPTQNVTVASTVPSMPASRSFSSNQYGNRAHQSTGHQKASQPNKEWKPKSSLKPSATGPGTTGASPKTVSPPAETSEDLHKESVQLQESVSQLNISENQNVIIASHIRVSETDRCRLTFGTLGAELCSSPNSVLTTNEGAEELSTKPSGSVSVSIPDPSADENVGNKQLDTGDDSGRSSESHSPASADQQLTEKDSSGSRNLENYADVGLVSDNGPSYTPEPIPQQDACELRSFSSYDPSMACDMSYFRPMVDETVRGSGLPSSQEQMLGPHTTNAVPASIAMMQQQQQHQQQQQQLAQMYPSHLHLPHFAGNVVPYRQFISPLYVPPMAVPGYSNNPAYPHPSNGSSYVIMPGNSSHLTPGGLKYGIQQFKPVPAGSPTGFGNFAGPTGYTVNTPGVVGSTPGHEDTSRLKYKDSLYLPNPQAETSEIWMNHPRDISGLQSPYYNMQGQTAHTYLPSHNGHTNFNVAAAAQSSHMQFSGMYQHHPQTQPTAMANPHHMGPGIGGNIGMGVAGLAPGAQVGAYQQPQLGHVNWA